MTLSLSRTAAFPLTFGGQYKIKEIRFNGTPYTDVATAEEEGRFSIRNVSNSGVNLTASSGLEDEGGAIKDLQTSFNTKAFHCFMALPDSDLQDLLLTGDEYRTGSQLEQDDPYATDNPKSKYAKKFEKWHTAAKHQLVLHYNTMGHLFKVDIEPSA